MSIGIVGLPNVGKSTLFNALTNNNILAANYPFATIDPNTGVVPIPDARLDVLAKIYQTNKIVPATVEFIDIAGLVAGAHKGEGLGNQFLANIRACRAVCHVVRVFEDSDVQHVADRPHPKKDIEIINTELVLADLQTVEKRFQKFEKEARANPKLKPVLESLELAKKCLNEGRQANTLPDSDLENIFDLQLITAKPVIYLFNLSEASLADDQKKQELSSLVSPAEAVFVSAKLEDELRVLDEVDRQELLAGYGQTESGLVKLISSAYKALGLQSYLTAGPKEVRAWTISEGFTAPQAAGVIHSDFERGFISAQIVDYQDLVTAGSEIAAKNAGKIRTEGKNYVMQPGDVVEFRFNV